MQPLNLNILRLHPQWGWLLWFKVVFLKDRAKGHRFIFCIALQRVKCCGPLTWFAFKSLEYVCDYRNKTKRCREVHKWREVGGFKHLHVAAKQPNRASPTPLAFMAWFNTKNVEPKTCPGDKWQKKKTPKHLDLVRGNFLNVWCEMCSQKNKYKVDALRTKPCCVLSGTCIVGRKEGCTQWDGVRAGSLTNSHSTSMWWESACTGPSCGNWAIRHSKDTPAVHEEASQSKWSCSARVRRTFHCFSPSAPSPFGTERNVWKRWDGWKEWGGESSLVVVSLSLFGEFADDADQCSIFIFKTLIVCSQVNQNLQVEVKAHIKSSPNRENVESKCVLVSSLGIFHSD